LQKEDIPFDKLRARWFYISGLSGKSAKTLVPIVNFAKKNKIKIALNPGAAQLRLGLKKLKNILSAVDVLILNQEEAARLSGFKRLNKYVQGIVIMTKGPEGVVVSDGKNLYQAGIFKEKRHIDRTGAGDAFGSGFVAGLIRSNKIEEAIRSGTANSASIVEHWGAKNGILSKSQILKDKQWKKLKIIKSKL
jgi:ribokinase